MNSPFDDPAKREEFLELAARIFGVSRATLAEDTAKGDIAEWDSVNHLRLVMEAEAAFQVRYPLERIPALARISDFFD